MTNEEKFKEIFGITTGRLYNMPSSCLHKWENEKYAEQRTGRWIECYNKWWDLVIGYKCSECSEFFSSKHNYCPNCGAKMKNE